MRPEISDHGLIGNCRTGALISKTGDLNWCCLPHFDSPSFFASILDENNGGSFSLSPSQTDSVTQTYLGETNVLRTVFQSGNTALELTDCFTVFTEKEKREHLLPTTEILRVVESLEGESVVRMHFEPRPDFGKSKIKITRKGKLGFRCEHQMEILFFQTNLDYDQINLIETKDRCYLEAEFKQPANQKIYFSLCYSNLAPAIIPPIAEAEMRFEMTAVYWVDWISKCTYKGLYEDQVRRSALALKLMTFAPSGAIVAAPTTSLPEKIGGVRNWDYRYCWLRDASFTVRSFLAIGLIDEARAYVNWMLHTTHLTSPRLQTLYTLYGESRVPEKKIPWLSGFKKSKPVRVGNAADVQFQLDVYGEVLNAIYYFSPSEKEFDPATKRFVLNLGKSVCDLWKCPDEGIWEVRSAREHHTHSKVLAWVALDRIQKIAKNYKWDGPMDEFRKTAEEIRTSIEAHSFNEELNAYTRFFGSNRLDASVLVMPLVEYCDANSDRMKKTTNTIMEKLSHNGLLYRYLGVDDGLPEDEGAFELCNFWLVQTLAKAGRIDEAKKWFEEVINRSNSLNLLSEELDPNSGEYLGNYPQAFSHSGLINAALTITQEINKGQHYEN